MTTKQLNAYLARHFPHLHGQISFHGAGRYSVQVFSTSGLILDRDIDPVERMTRIGQHIRRALNRETEFVRFWKSLNAFAEDAGRPHLNVREARTYWAIFKEVA